MTLLYVDTSALAKVYLTEIGSSWMRKLVSPTAGHTIIICEFTPLEFFSLLMRRVRDNNITSIAAIILQSAFLNDYATQYLSINLLPSVLIDARRLILQYGLRPPDAVQLASALEARTTLGGTFSFICADVNLLSAATAEGLATDNPNLYP